jgi:hypothetical protein
MKPKLMTDIQLLQALAVKAVALTSDTLDLIDSKHDNRISQEFFALKTEISKRMGESREGPVLIKELTSIAISAIGTERPDNRIQKRYEQVKRKILQIIAENFTVVTIAQN